MSPPTRRSGDGSPEARSNLRVVVAAGGYRSGSTLQYNLLGLYLERLGRGRRLGYVLPDDASSLVAQWARHGDGLGVVKCHHVATGFRPFRAEDAWARFVRGGIAVAMTTCRDEQAVRASMCRKFGYPDDALSASLEWRENVANAEAWSALGAFEQQYRDLVGRPVRAVRGLADWLRVPWSRMAFIQAWARTRPVVVRRHQRTIPQGAWDPVTLVHPAHIGRSNPRFRLRGERSEPR